MEVGAVKIHDGGSVNWQPGKHQGVRKETSDLPKETFVSGGNDWTPVKPNVSAATSKTSGLRSLGGALMLSLGLALTIGATGCASVATAQAAEKTPIIQTQPKPAKDGSASYQVGKGLHDIGVGAKEAAQPALDKGKEVGKKGWEKGKEATKDIGTAGKNFGLGVAKEAKSLWKGLTGKE